MKRFIMPLAAFLMVGTVLFTGCNGNDEVPEEEPPVVDTLTPPADVDTLVVDTAGTGTEVKVVDSDSAKKAAARNPKKKDETIQTDGNTATKRGQRPDNTSSTPTTPNQEPVKDSVGTTVKKRPQRP